ncbi:MAG: DUF2252 family protein [Ectothiorhodospiraceae bacterium]|nr:DUF2252 family protein [Chromatiales bacterium]MCP5154321.1 DUF2252 family protein [Ectothiorhodospiraceae bacterium]
MHAQDTVERILAFNAGRDPERLRMKLDRLAAGPLRFLRGTCHLFFADVAGHPVLEASPRAWLCGDLHIENFGSYRGDNGLVYFDMNDFDESLCAPCNYELVRLLVSIVLARAVLRIGRREARRLARRFLEVYARELAAAKPRWVERDLARGLVRSLLRGARKHARKDFVGERTRKVRVAGARKRRRLDVDGRRALPATAADARRIEALVESALSTDGHRMRVRDVARRVAGTGSLGIERFVVLAEDGEGDLVLLDLKEARPSATAAALGHTQPPWASDARRIVSVQRWLQAIPPGIAIPVEHAGRSHVLRALQPSADRVDLVEPDVEVDAIEAVITTMAEVTAWGHVRAAGRAGADGVDTLARHGADASWLEPLLAVAEDEARRTEAHFTAFREAHARGQTG